MEMLEKAGPAYDRRVLRTIVYENPHAINALPRDIFTGPFDERWGREGDVIKRVFIGPALMKLKEAEHGLELDQGPFHRYEMRRARAKTK